MLMNKMKLRRSAQTIITITANANCTTIRTRQNDTANLQDHRGLPCGYSMVLIPTVNRWVIISISAKEKKHTLFNTICHLLGGSVINSRKRTSSLKNSTVLPRILSWTKKWTLATNNSLDRYYNKGLNCEAIKVKTIFVRHAKTAFK